jgi:outer membrane usher protein
MAQRPRKAQRWPIALAEALFLQASLVGVGLAADATADATSASAAAGALDDGDRALPADESALYLEVIVNGMNRGFARFAQRDGELMASAATLRKFGIVLPADAPDLVRVTALPGLHINYDVAQQKLVIDAPLAALDLPKTVLDAPRTDTPRVTTSPGALLNYDIYGTLGEHQTGTLNAFSELRVFGPFGVLSSTALAQNNYSNATGWQDRFDRLDTTWTLSFPERLLALRIGDTLTDSLSWSRATRIGGIQFGTDFSLQPYRITAPLPGFIGSATLPSEVELYVNGMKQYSGNVPAGPFQLNTLPNINGAGNAQIVLTDALGRATTLNFSLYATHQLLAQGLSDWSGELGVVRESYGQKSFDYGHDAVASGTWRYGVTNSFTAEAHAETTDGLVDAGAGGALRLGQVGIVSGAYARSTDHGRSGSLWNLGYEWRDDHFGFSTSATRTQGDFADVATRYGAAPARLNARAQASYSTPEFGSFSLGYLHLRYAEQTATRYATGNWFKAFGRTTSVNLSVNQNLDSSRDRSIFLGVSIALHDNISMSVGAARDQNRSYAVAEASSAAPTEGGLGWRAALRAGDGSNDGSAELDYLGRYGRVAVGVNSTGDNRYGYLDVTGAVVFMAGHPFVARHVDTAFAVVSTDGLAGVPVTLENRPVGTTDARGLLLVTPLNAYQNNQIAIDPMNLPADLHIERVRAIAAPGDRSGTLVRFGVSQINAASIVLVDAANKPLPLGTEVVANGAAESALIGFDGVVYLERLKAQNTLDVRTSTGNCRVHFDYTKQGDGIPQLGPLTCRKEPP